jgi:hypothetical protein
MIEIDHIPGTCMDTDIFFYLRMRERDNDREKKRERGYLLKYKVPLVPLGIKFCSVIIFVKYVFLCFIKKF